MAPLNGLADQGSTCPPALRAAEQADRAASVIGAQAPRRPLQLIRQPVGRTNMNKIRLVIALLLSPLACPIALLITGLVGSIMGVSGLENSPFGGLFLSFYALPIAYVMTFIFAPCCLWYFLRIRKPYARYLTFSGAILGAIPFFIYFAYVIVAEFLQARRMSHIPAELIGSRSFSQDLLDRYSIWEPLGWILLGTFSGAAVAYSFWRIYFGNASANPPNNSPKPTPPGSGGAA